MSQSGYAKSGSRCETNRHWTNEEERRLIKLRSSIHINDLVKIFGRTAPAIHDRVKRLRKLNRGNDEILIQLEPPCEELKPRKLGYYDVPPNYVPWQMRQSDRNQGVKTLEQG